MSEPAELPPQKRKRGKIEKATRRTIKDMRLEGTAAQKMMIEQALAGAKILDEAMEPGKKRYVANVGQRLHKEALEGLRASVKPPEPVAAVEDDEDDPMLGIKAMHHRSITCQPTFPITLPGVCAGCDEATRAVGILVRRHPGKVPHDFSRAIECRCAKCLARS